VCTLCYAFVVRGADGGDGSGGPEPGPEGPTVTVLAPRKGAGVLVSDTSRLRLLGLEDENKDLRKQLRDREQELDVSATALREAEVQITTQTALVEDLKKRMAEDGSTVRVLNRQLREMVLVHRQLLRKVRHGSTISSEDGAGTQTREGAGAHSKCQRSGVKFNLKLAESLSRGDSRLCFPLSVPSPT
jgi:hypothetical protein